MKQSISSHCATLEKTLIKELIEIQGKQVRFAVNYAGEKRKIFTLFNAASDGSLAFHTYIPSNFVGQINSDTLINGQTFNINDADYKDFEVHKFNFHKSGTGNIKDKSGNRPSNDYTSIAFDVIKDAANLLIYQPTHFSQFPLIEDNKKYYDLLDNKSENIPPNVQIILSHKEFDIIEHFKNNKDSIMFIHYSILEKFDLNLCINVRRHITGKFPKYDTTYSITY